MNTGRLQLPTVSLVLVETRPSLVPLARRVMEHCLASASFFTASLFTSHLCWEHIHRHAEYSVDVVSLNDYSNWILREMFECVPSTASHVLVVQTDGFIVNPSAWSADWLTYDYVGAPWDAAGSGVPDNRRVGNGGFSLRSMKFLRAAANLSRSMARPAGMPEDVWACVHLADTLEKRGVKFAPPEVAARFSGEMRVPETVATPFGFHGLRHGRENFLKTVLDWNGPCPAK